MQLTYVVAAADSLFELEADVLIEVEHAAVNIHCAVADHADLFLVVGKLRPGSAHRAVMEMDDSFIIGEADQLHVELLDVMTELFDDFNYEVVEDKVLSKKVHADTDIRTGHIRIKESVYEGACNGEGRDRMTIAHEIGHYFTLCFCGFRLERNFSGGKIPAFRDPEWQAKCFAGELMVPAHRVKGMDAYEIADQCGVSYDAACVQYKHLPKE